VNFIKIVLAACALLPALGTAAAQDRMPPIPADKMTDAQKKAAEESKKIAAAHFKDPIVTGIVTLTKFYPAEDYHQEYFTNNGNQPYCQFVVAPKVKKFEQKFAQKIKV